MKSGWWAIFYAGLSAGILDLTAALFITVWFGRTPVQLLHLVASGLLGSEAYQSGVIGAVFGATLHFVIAFAAAAVYFTLSRTLDMLVRWPVWFGIFYGIAVYHVMNLIVLPLSAYPHPISPTAESYIRGLIVHILCVGLPISLVISRFSKTHSSIEAVLQ